MANTTEKCPTEVWEKPGYTHTHVCGRPVKRDGRCGIHARMHERREAQRKAWKGWTND